MLKQCHSILVGFTIAALVVEPLSQYWPFVIGMACVMILAMGIEV